MHGRFVTLARIVSQGVGSAYAFGMALSVILVWGASGPLFHFNDTWQLVINTGTTIVTFLIVFLIQATQNRDAAALHAKLDELIRAMPEAHDELRGIEQSERAEERESC